MKRVLILDDNLTICLMLKSWLVKENYKVETSTSVSDATQKVKEMPFDLILSDIRMPDADGFSFLSWVKKYDSDIIVIMMTGFADIETAVESMKSGAVDYIAKPIDPELLFKKIDEAFKKQVNSNQPKTVANAFVVSSGEKYKKLSQLLDEAVPSDSHLLIIGSRGTGKSSVVRYIYEKGFHSSKPFIIMDCEQIVREQEWGLNAFAENGKSALKGYLDMAKGGLLFVRKIANLDKILQAELATVLQNQIRDDEYTRIILTSEYEKAELKKALLPKLYQLLEDNCIELPCLKGQKEDILFFADYFLNFANIELNKNITGIDDEIQKMLVEHSWDENIQELKNTILKAALLTEETIIGADIAPNLFKNNYKTTVNLTAADILGLKKENYEKEKIMEALEIAKGNKTMAASILNIDRKTLYNKIKLYDVEMNN